MAESIAIACAMIGRHHICGVFFFPSHAFKCMHSNARCIARPVFASRFHPLSLSPHAPLVCASALQKDLAYYAETASALGQYSPGALIFVLIHKMDLVPEESREGVFAERSAAVHARSGHFAAPTFATSIWDETLYKAWSSVVHTLIPNIKV